MSRVDHHIEVTIPGNIVKVFSALAKSEIHQLNLADLIFEKQS